LANFTPPFLAKIQPPFTLPKEYKQRTKIETVHYVIKRKFGDSIRSMNKINSRKEVIMKFLVYNIHRIIKENKNIINYFLKRISTRLLIEIKNLNFILNLKFYKIKYF